MLKSLVLAAGLLPMLIAGCESQIQRRHLAEAQARMAAPGGYEQWYKDSSRLRAERAMAPYNAVHDRIEARLERQKAEREAQQGSGVRALSERQCEPFMSVPSVKLTPAETRMIGHDRYVNESYTPQEQYCHNQAVANSVPANNVFPGMLPDGARAVYTGNGHWVVHY